MARKVKWTLVALSDLDSVAEYIAIDSPNYAAAFVREVRDAARSLQNLALRGRKVPEFNDHDIRELLIRGYRLIYLINKETVYIIGFIHGAREI